ncbi:trehalose operon repressor [Paenibacillus sp. URB8-2]|uniref:trehalose operon repressor n=1 Tax=Paenibacillus sp. URB8-2 TaxID=2741301 RepID=UPI0015C0210F|nr:trehalose operon repressor [Paenibacillus sp. URB8-2]BCG58817.1 HTH-type transcriptional regulator TreR [Paenibacillus sp. URB8-2]
MSANIYWTIYNDYAEKIQNGDIPAGAKIPSESELADSYGTSRETVRKALGLLSQNGYIHKVKGKGSFVLDLGKMKFPITGLISFKEMSEKMGRKSRTLVHKTEQVPASRVIAAHLDLKEGTTVWEVIRSREIEGERVILDKDYFVPERVGTLTPEIAARSIYDYLENTLKLLISYAKKEISVEPATPEDRALLDLNNLSHVVVVRNYVYLEDTALFQYTESRHRLDKFQFVDFARRAH